MKFMQDRIGTNCRAHRSPGSLILPNRKLYTADHNRVSTAVLDRLALMPAANLSRCKIANRPVVDCIYQQWYIFRVTNFLMFMFFLT